MSWHHMPLQSVIESLKTDSRTGLTKEQARKVLDVNKSERHIRGGLATREKYLHQHGR